MDAQAGLPLCYWHAITAGFLRSRPYSDKCLFPGLTGLDGLPGRDGEPGLLGRKGEQGDMGIPGKDGPLYILRGHLLSTGSTQGDLSQ